MAWQDYASGVGKGLQEVTHQAALTKGLSAAASMFKAIGTPEAAQYGELLASDPDTAASLAEQFGGPDRMYAALRDSAFQNAQLEERRTATAAELSIAKENAAARAERADRTYNAQERHRRATEAQAAETQARLGSQNDQAVISSYQAGYTSDTKKLTERLQYADAADEAMRLAEAGNAIGSEAAKTQIARLAGEVGALSNQDINRFGGSKAIGARINQAAQQAYDGTLTKENAKFMRQIVEGFQVSIRRQKKVRLKKFASKLAMAKGGTLAASEEEAAMMLDPDVEGDSGPAPAAPAVKIPAGAVREGVSAKHGVVYRLPDGTTWWEGKQ